MLILRVFSVLLSYPQRQTFRALNELAKAVRRQEILREPHNAAVLNFIACLGKSDLIDWQERYVNTFDRQQSLSLHLFEHVHGESRIRGQALVDLLEFYRGHGFEVTQHELPDYLPLFLEFASQQNKEESLRLLNDILPIIDILRKRLLSQRSAWFVVFDALVSLAGHNNKLESETATIPFTPTSLPTEQDPNPKDAPQFLDSSVSPKSPCQSCAHSSKDCPATKVLEQGPSI